MMNDTCLKSVEEDRDSFDLPLFKITPDQSVNVNLNGDSLVPHLNPQTKEELLGDDFNSEMLATPVQGELDFFVNDD